MSQWNREYTAYAKIDKALTVQPGKREWYLLKGAAVLERPVYFKYIDVIKRVQICDLKVIFNEAIQEDDDQTPNRATLSVLIEDYTEGDDDNRADCDLSAILTIYAPSKSKSDLFSAVSDSLQVTLNGVIDTEWEKAIDVDKDGRYIECEVQRPHVVWQFGEIEEPSWLMQAKQQAVWEKFESFPLGIRSQVYYIYEEFSKSFSNSTDLALPKSGDIFAVNQLICNIRSALRPLDREDQGSYYSLWSNSPYWARRYSVKLSSDDAKVFCDKYDQLWQNFNVVHVLQRGEAAYGATSAGFEPKVDELENAARELIKLPNEFNSERLENILINALLYAEAISFAQFVYSKDKLFGQKIAAPIKGTESESITSKGALYVISRAVTMTAGGLFKELGKIGLAFVIAYVVTAQNLTAAWMITTGVTLYRWLANLMIQLKGTQEQKEVDLVLAMAQLHEMSNKPDCSPNMLYQELIRVTQLGARFSPMVAVLLERRIALAQKN